MLTGRAAKESWVRIQISVRRERLPRRFKARYNTTHVPKLTERWDFFAAIFVYWKSWAIIKLKFSIFAAVQKSNQCLISHMWFKNRQCNYRRDKFTFEMPIDDRKHTNLTTRRVKDFLNCLRKSLNRLSSFQLNVVSTTKQFRFSLRVSLHCTMFRLRVAFLGLFFLYYKCSTILTKSTFFFWENKLTWMNFNKRFESRELP